MGSSALGINASGQVVGWAYLSDNETSHAFLYSNGTMTDLQTLGGSSSDAWARSINANGQIVGYSYIASGPYHACLWSNGNITDLGTLGGGQSEAYSINSAGQIVGNSVTKGGAAWHACLWSNGNITDLGTLAGYADSGANSVNDSGEAVGWAVNMDGSGIQHAVLFSNGTATDLDDLISPTSGWTLVEAFAINDSGQTCGYGTSPNGDTHAFLLTPTPEPSTLALLAIGAISLLGYAWRRQRRVA